MNDSFFKHISRTPALYLCRIPFGILPLRVEIISASAEDEQYGRISQIKKHWALFLELETDLLTPVISHRIIFQTAGTYTLLDDISINGDPCDAHGSPHLEIINLIISIHRRNNCLLYTSDAADEL